MNNIGLSLFVQTLCQLFFLGLNGGSKKAYSLHLCNGCKEYAVLVLVRVVELEGVEPSSKRGINLLSTYLSLLVVFEYQQDQSYRLIP